MMWTPPWMSNALGKLIFDAAEPGSKPYTTVYRLQDEKGMGIYQTGALLHVRVPPGKEKEWAREHRRRHPTPYDDFVPSEWANLPMASRYYFAFATPKDAEKWFGKLHIEALKAQGVTLVPRKAHKVYLSESGRQVIFLPAD